MTSASFPRRLLVIGAGRVAERYYAPALRRNKRFGVSGVVDPSAERRMWAEAQMGAPVFASPAEAFAAASYDAALILAPPRFQPDVLRDVLSHGLSILTEKPGARTATEADIILATAQGLPVRVALARRYWRGYQAIRTRIGALPTRWRVAIATDPSDWGHLDPSQSDGVDGLIDDLLPHAYDVATAVVGADLGEPSDPKRVGDSLELSFGEGRSIYISHRDGGWRETVRWTDASGATQEADLTKTSLFSRVAQRAGMSISGPVEAIDTLLDAFAADLDAGRTNDDFLRLATLNEQTRKLLNL